MLLCGSNRELVVALRWPFLGWITFLSFDFYLFGRSAIVYPILINCRIQESLLWHDWSPEQDIEVM